MPTTLPIRQQFKPESRQRLEAAAPEASREAGLPGYLIGEIVALAGTTRTTFYEQFQGKSELIHHAQDRKFALCANTSCSPCSTGSSSPVATTPSSPAPNWVGMR
jgi:AcrR family transcriptional regulator